MLRDIVATYLETLTEREFDAPLLAILAREGFTDVHFVHGAFEFGKDVIARRSDPASGRVFQYSIQAKAGDMGQAGWRDVRPQLEEAEYNTRAHPGFDASLPRIAVLVTTGRLKGAAAIDAQEFRDRVSSRGLADFEVWDREKILGWLCDDPGLGIAGQPNVNALLTLVTTIRSGRVTEPELERYTRGWLSADSPPALRRACVEAALLSHAAREEGRLDLSAFVAIHLLRAAESTSIAGYSSVWSEEVATAAVRLYRETAYHLLCEVEGLIDDPLALARQSLHPVSIASYPALCSRLAELLALFVLVETDPERRRRGQVALVKLSQQLGASRPISDRYAASILPHVVVVSASDPAAGRDLLRRMLLWLFDRHDADHSGLGLGSLDETEAVAVERLLGGALTGCKLERRQSSYAATVLMDLTLILGAKDLFEAASRNMAALRIVPTITAAAETRAMWRRSGDDVWPQPRVDYGGWSDQPPTHYSVASHTSPERTMLLMAGCRSRHSVPAALACLASIESLERQIGES